MAVQILLTMDEIVVQIDVKMVLIVVQTVLTAVETVETMLFHIPTKKSTIACHIDWAVVTMLFQVFVRKDVMLFQMLVKKFAMFVPIVWKNVQIAFHTLMAVCLILSQFW